MASRRISKDESAEVAGVGAPLPPVHAAIINKDVSKLAELIQTGSAQVHPESQDTPLHTAARVGSIECLRWLLENRIKSPLDRSRSGSTPAHYAAVYGRLEALKLVVSHDRQRSQEIAEQTDDNGLSILSLATLQGNLKMVQWIVENFGNIGHIADGKGNLPIHFAAAGGSISIIKYFVQQYGKEYAEKRDKSQTAPVYYAAQDGKIDVLKYLVDGVGVDPVAKDLSGMSTIHAASMGHQLEVVKWLVNKVGPKSIIDKTKDGATPLHIAAAHGCSEMLQFFLDKLEDRDDINVLDHIHATPAHDAAEFGQQETLLMLLKHGANISIKDTEDKTPFDLAVEKQFTEIARMIGDYRERGVKGLEKYEQPKKTSSVELSAKPSGELTSSPSQTSSKKRHERNPADPVRTSREEAEDISSVIMEASGLIERRRDKELTRKKSMEQLYKAVSDESDSADDLEKQLLSRSDRNGSRRSRSKSRRNKEDEQNLLDHELGPEGHIYTRVKKRSKDKKLSRDNDEQLSEASSHVCHAVSTDFDDQGYSTVHNNHNLETSSNYSRPSRVKNYPDNESEASYRSGSTASRSLHSGRHNVPGFYPPQGYYPSYPMPPPPPGRHRPPRSISGSSLGSQSSAGNSHHHRHHPMRYPPPGPPGHPMAPYPGPHYPYHPAMVAQYYGYQWQGRPYTQPKPKSTEDRMHMEALRRGGHPPWVPPAGFPPPQGHRKGRHQQMHKKPRSHHRGPPSTGSGPGSATHLKQHPLRTTRHRDVDIGFGPTDEPQSSQPELDRNDTNHPLPPPITHGQEGVDREENDIVEEGNFLLMKPVDGEEPPNVDARGTRLVRAKKQVNWDEYIMTDSEEEREIPDHISIARVMESALICSLAPIACLPGLNKIRKTKSTENMFDDLAHRSSAWDDTGGMRARSRRGSFSEDPAIAGLSPHEFANLEEQKTAKNWASQNDQQAVSKAEAIEMAALSLPTQVEPKAASKEEAYSQILPKELKPATMSAQLGISHLGGSLRARNFALEQFAPTTLTSSRLSLDHDDQDDDDDIISVIHGLDPRELEEKKKAKKQAKSTGSGKKEKSKKTKEKDKKEKSKEKSKKEEQATERKEEKSKSKEKPKDKQKSKSKAKDGFSLVTTAEASPALSKGKENSKPKGKAPPSRPAPSPPTNKLMKVVPTPPSERKEHQLTASKSSKSAAASTEFKLKSQSVTTQPASGETVTSVGVSVGNKQKSRPISVEPREMKINFGDLDSSSDEGDEEGEVVATGVTRLSGSMEDLFSETQKQIDSMMAGLSDMDSGDDKDAQGEVAFGISNEVEPVQTALSNGELDPSAAMSGSMPLDVYSLMQYLNITPDKVTPQVMMKLQMVQNILNLKNPELTTDLKNLLDQGWNPVQNDAIDPMESSSSTQLVADLQSKLQETEQQIRSQAAFGHSLEKRLEEQHERHTQSIQALIAQLKEQKDSLVEEKKRKEEDEKKKRRRKKSRKSDSDSDSESVPSTRRGKHKKKSGSGMKGTKYQFKGILADSDSDHEPLLSAVPATPAPVTAAKFKTATMQAQIVTQDLLTWEDFEKAEIVTVEERDIPDPPSPPSPRFLLSAIDPRSKFKRKATRMQLEDHSRAMERFAAGKFDNDDDDDDDDDIAMQPARPMKGSVRRAEMFRLLTDDSENYTTDEQGVARLAASRPRITRVH